MHARIQGITGYAQIANELSAQLYIVAAQLIPACRYLAKALLEPHLIKSQTLTCESVESLPIDWSNILYLCSLGAWQI